MVLADLSSAYQDAIIPYAKIWNTGFAERIRYRLPPEIRSLVYSYLWDIDRPAARDLAKTHIRSLGGGLMESKTIATYPCILRLSRAIVSLDEKGLRRLYDRHGLPHYLNPEYVGHHIALEVAEALYQALDTAGLLHCLSQNLGKLLGVDCFRLGLDMKSTIRHLTVHCEVDRYRVRGPKCKHLCQHTAADLACLQHEALKRDFEPLLEIKRQGQFQLNILLIQRSIRIYVLAEAVTALGEVYKRFCDDGNSITVTWTYRGNWCDCGIHISDHQEVISKNITTFFEMPREAWAYNMRRFLDKVRDHVSRAALAFHTNSVQARPSILDEDWAIEEEENQLEPKDAANSELWVINLWAHRIWERANEELPIEVEDEFDDFDEGTQQSDASEASEAEVTP
jgi:hypothetical protein